MSSDRIYYKLEADGVTEKQLKLFIEDRRSINQAWFEFSEKFGAKEIWCNDRLMAIKLDFDKVPMGWSTNRDLPSGFYRPGRLKVCMDSYKEFKALGSKPRGLDLSGSLGIDVVYTKQTAHFPSYEFVGNLMLLSIHKDSNNIPNDVVALKMSEYWELKEDAEQEA